MLMVSVGCCVDAEEAGVAATEGTLAAKASVTAMIEPTGGIG
jgi:hypothetical protein